MMIPIDAEKLRAREEGALGDLYKELAPAIARFAGRFHPSIDPDDLVSEVFLQLVRDPDRLADLAASGNLRAFCLRLARNVALHHIRRIRRATALETVYESSLSMPQHRIDEDFTEERELIIAALAGLKESERALIKMRFIEELSDGEIAQTLGLSQGGVRVKFHRALRHLRDILQNQRRGQASEG